MEKDFNLCLHDILKIRKQQQQILERFSKFEESLKTRDPELTTNQEQDYFDVYGAETTHKSPWEWSVPAWCCAHGLLMPAANDRAPCPSCAISSL